ncbi:probable pectin lyase B [Thrips palmi]|uniref:pectin lyase n=1 Tax=Thrips palmi TaxID=161013 RepID=A0A6P8YFD0_THRPL|nr:probable pectin lyase B [Thrips palmi]
MARTLLALMALAAVTVTAEVTNWDPDCIQEPVGFGRGTVGGEGGKTVTPKNIKELKNFLKDDVPRIILLDKTFDFTGSQGLATSDGCFFKKCGPGFQYSLAQSDTCDGREMTNVTYDAAGPEPLNVGSFKTIMGVNGKGVLRGKGLKIRKAQQVIIRDISIVDINPAVIWGGDALTFNGVDQVWIHNVTFKNIGRQFLVSYQTSNTGVTVSSCTFDGHTTNSAYCDGKHYWVWLFWGTDDRITLINNKIVNTSGRLPHAGGYLGSKNFIHIVGNHFDGNSDVALEPWDGALLLVEGNRFCGMNNLVNSHATNGNVFLVSTATQAARCEAAFGEDCLRNAYHDTQPVRRCNGRVLEEALAMDLCPEAINDARRAVCMPVPDPAELVDSWQD